MEKVLPLLFFALAFASNAFSQACTTTNATTCDCKDGSSNCDLLPNITLAEEPLLVPGNNGVIEYSQNGNGAEDGRLRVSVSTPNIGHGPLTVRTTSRFVCGPDTFTSNPGTCQDGSSPRQMVVQRVYHKNGNTMTYYDRDAGTMTYHPTHGHMHVDDWGIYTLRKRDTTIADPMQWPIIGQGAKLGFCLMDYGDCTYYSGHCEDSAGNTLLNGDFPNWGLGGGSYNCSPTEQGISSGYTDIYYQYLDGMYIDLPPTTCNGDYYIVVKIDPHGYFLEENENDNVIAIPYVLTKQLTGSSATAMASTLSPCEGASVTLTASAGNSYLWNTMDTTQVISVSTPGDYSVQVASECGTATSQIITITPVQNHIDSAHGLTICEATPITLNAYGTGTMYWFDSSAAGNQVFVGDNFNTAPGSTITYYVESRDSVLGVSAHVGPVDNTIGSGSNYNNNQYQIFDVMKTVVLKSVKVYAGSTSDRTIELRNSAGTVLQTLTQNIAQGTQVVNLNFTIQPGTNYQLGWDGTTPDWYRNSSGANYPYTVASLISVTGNSANDPVRWYAYYDWQVEEPAIACTSPRTPVTVSVSGNPVVSFSGLSSQYFNTDAAVTLSGTPAGGTFSGTGINGNTFDPAVAGVGGPYTITYNYTDVNGCSASSTFDVTVVEDGSIDVNNIDGISRVNIFPNPSNGEFGVMMHAIDTRKIDMVVTDATGRKVFAESNLSVNGTSAKKVNLKNAAKGVYQLTITCDKQSNNYQIVVK